MSSRQKNVNNCATNKDTISHSAKMVDRSVSIVRVIIRWKALRLTNIFVIEVINSWWQLRGSTQGLWNQIRSFAGEIDRSLVCYRTEGKHLPRIIGALFVERYWTRATAANARFIVHCLRSVRVVFTGDGVLSHLSSGKRHAIHVDREEKGSCMSDNYIHLVSMVTFARCKIETRGRNDRTDSRTTISGNLINIVIWRQ